MDTIQPFSHTNKSQERMKYFNFTKNEIDQFSSIFQKAQIQTNQGVSSKDQLKSMSNQDKELIRRYRSLADSIENIDQLSDEGASNLLRQYGNEVDLNNDAIVDVGKAKNFIFPPVNSSQKVKDAWNETTKDMSPKEKMLAELPFLITPISANLKVNHNNKVIGVHEPGSPNYVNPFSRAGFSWDQLISDIQDHYNDYKTHYTNKQYNEVMNVMNKFSKNLNRPLS